MPAQENATLTRIAGAGTDEDWDEPGEPGDEKWAGEVGAYYSEKRERVFGGGDQDVVLRRTLIVSHDAVTELDNDDLVTFTYAGSQQTAKVSLIERRDLAGLPPSVRTTRLTLEAG